MIEREDKGFAKRRSFGQFGVVAALLGVTIAGFLLVLSGDSGTNVVISMVVGGVWVLTGGVLGILGWRDRWGKLALFLVLCVIAIVGYMIAVYFFSVSEIPNLRRTGLPTLNGGN